MFEQLLESTTAKKTRNPWAYAVSVTVQVIALGVLILIPLLYTEALPQQQMLSWLVAPPPPPPPPPPAAQPVRRVKRVSLMEAGKLRAPREIPREIEIIRDDPQEDMGGVVGGVPGGVPGGQMGGVIGGVLGGIPSAVPPPPKPEAPKRIRVSSGVQEAKMIHRADPTYPPLAKQARIFGTVRLEAVIAADGSIQNLRVIEGHPLLVQSALQAVQQWRYQPTLLSGEPVEVVTFIEVVFRLY
ncbi:MAG: energy transducer TonB [Acidobacteria bacterium RIFCSPHIGHO2_01_FULL_67_28]|nr:MAG: energy transducer TonB [Acidobacteria bacterium RIFCSPHIGHO2_01_FULL_67_28]